jgi:hypothetical protein
MASNAPDIITLDNLSQTLTPWNPQGESQLYAIVDMGRYIHLHTKTEMQYLIIFQQWHSVLNHLFGAAIYTSSSPNLLNSGCYLTV